MIFIDVDEDRLPLLAYVVHIVSFKVLSAAISYVRTNLLDETTGYRGCVTRDFGRHCSPLATARDRVEAGSEEGKCEVHCSVQVEEHDELDALLPGADF